MESDPHQAGEQQQPGTQLPKALCSSPPISGLEIRQTFKRKERAAGGLALYNKAHEPDRAATIGKERPRGCRRGRGVGGPAAAATYSKAKKSPLVTKMSTSVR